MISMLEYKGFVTLFDYVNDRVETVELPKNCYMKNGLPSLYLVKKWLLSSFDSVYFERLVNMPFKCWCFVYSVR